MLDFQNHKYDDKQCLLCTDHSRTSKGPAAAWKLQEHETSLCKELQTAAYNEL